MRISSVIINNYKSIGTQKNTLLLEDDVTALIGKNDSGKSNVLEILGGISFSHYILDEFYKYNNGSSEEKLSLSVFVYTGLYDQGERDGSDFCNESGICCGG